MDEMKIGSIGFGGIPGLKIETWDTHRVVSFREQENEGIPSLR
jgi:hypothetical protein